MSDANFAFDGETYESKHDFERLKGQINRVYRVMSDGQWRTLSHLALVIGGSESSISARLRDLRKDRFGGHEVERQRFENGLFLYRLILSRVPEETASAGSI